MTRKISNCLGSTIFWFKYGYILGDLAMSLVNGFGLIMATYAGLIYHHNTVHRLSCQIMTIIGLTGVLLWMVSISSGSIKLDGVGFSAMIASVVMFASPLSAVFSIIKRHYSAGDSHSDLLLNRKKTSIWVSREGISLGMILTSLSVSLSWFLYGLCIRDTFVVIPNGLGMLMCAMQYAVWSISFPAKPNNNDSFGVANSNSSSRADSRASFLRLFKYGGEDRFDSNRDPLLTARPNSVTPIIEMKSF